MEIRVREDSVEITGYVNAVERASKPLMSRVGQFIERICKGAFKKALKRNNDVHILLNHNWDRDLGSTKKGNLELEEDNIGLRVRACITDKDVIQKARNGELVGWSFGFHDREVENTIERGIPHRAVKDLDLAEVSILDRTKTPAYDGTLIMARDDENGEMLLRGEDFIDEVSIIDKTEPQKEENAQNNENIVQNDKKLDNEMKENVEEKEEPKQQKVEDIDYSKYEEMIKEMKEEK